MFDVYREGSFQWLELGWYADHVHKADSDRNEKQPRHATDLSSTCENLLGETVRNHGAMIGLKGLLWTHSVR